MRRWVREHCDALVEILIILLVGMGVLIGATWFLMWLHDGIE